MWPRFYIGPSVSCRPPASSLAAAAQGINASLQKTGDSHWVAAPRLVRNQLLKPRGRAEDTLGQKCSKNAMNSLLVMSTFLRGRHKSSNASFRKPCSFETSKSLWSRCVIKVEIGLGVQVDSRVHLQHGVVH